MSGRHYQFKTIFLPFTVPFFLFNNDRFWVGSVTKRLPSFHTGGSDAHHKKSLLFPRVELFQVVGTRTDPSS